jgi:hypothetical protein
MIVPSSEVAPTTIQDIEERMDTFLQKWFVSKVSTPATPHGLNCKILGALTKESPIFRLSSPEGIASLALQQMKSIPSILYKGRQDILLLIPAYIILVGFQLISFEHLVNDF